jgi:hypothetical protein
MYGKVSFLCMFLLHTNRVALFYVALSSCCTGHGAFCHIHARGCEVCEACFTWGWSVLSVVMFIPIFSSAKGLGLPPAEALFLDKICGKWVVHIKLLYFMSFVTDSVHPFWLFGSDDITPYIHMCHISVLFSTSYIMYLCLATLFKHVCSLIIILLFIIHTFPLYSYLLQLICQQFTCMYTRAIMADLTICLVL